MKNFIAKQFIILKKRETLYNCLNLQNLFLQNLISKYIVKLDLYRYLLIKTNQIVRIELKINKNKRI